MSLIESFQPIRVIRLPRRRRGAQLRSFLLGLCIGYFGGGALAIVLGLLVNTLFPPSQYNVLLLGLDRRADQGGASRADTMILATVDPERHYAGMLSIPRDL